MYGLERVNQQLGEFVVVQGAGALGLYAVAVAKARGATRVIAIDGIPEETRTRGGLRRRCGHRHQ